MAIATCLVPGPRLGQENKSLIKKEHWGKLSVSVGFAYQGRAYR